MGDDFEGRKKKKTAEKDRGLSFQIKLFSLRRRK